MLAYETAIINAADELNYREIKHGDLVFHMVARTIANIYGEDFAKVRDEIMDAMERR